MHSTEGDAAEMATDTATTTIPDPAKPAATEPPAGAATAPASTTPPPPADDDNDVAKWKNLSRQNEAALRKAQKDLDDLRTATQTDAEKAINDAKKAGRSEADAEWGGRLLAAEIKVAATGKLAYPEDAAALLGDTSRFLDDKGNVDSKAITTAIDQLVKTKPKLAADGARASSLPGGGQAAPASGFSMNDAIRAKLGRG